MRSIKTAVILFLLFASVNFAQSGMINVKSSSDVKNTADKLEKILNEKGLTVFNRISHSAAAKMVGMKLRPTILIIFGNPKIGTKLMQCSQSFGLDLPLKALIWQDEAGQVWFSYNDPAYLAKIHNASGCDKVIAKVTKALEGISKAACAK